MPPRPEPMKLAILHILISTYQTENEAAHTYRIFGCYPTKKCERRRHWEGVLWQKLPKCHADQAQEEDVHLSLG